MEAERDLAEDAQWKKIQQNTFTRWANEHLKLIDKTIMSLETDLSDGLKLIALIEVLSQVKLSFCLYLKIINLLLKFCIHSDCPSNISLFVSFHVCRKE